MTSCLTLRASCSNPAFRVALTCAMFWAESKKKSVSTYIILHGMFLLGASTVCGFTGIIHIVPNCLPMADVHMITDLRVLCFFLHGHTSQVGNVYCGRPDICAGERAFAQGSLFVEVSQELLQPFQITRLICGASLTCLPLCMSPRINVTASLSTQLLSFGFLFPCTPLALQFPSHHS